MTLSRNKSSFACREVVAPAGLWERGAEVSGIIPSSARLLPKSETPLYQPVSGAPRAPKPIATPPSGGTIRLASKTCGYELLNTIWKPKREREPYTASSLFSVLRVIAQSGVLASESSGDQIDLRHLKTVFELYPSYHLGQVVEAA